MDKHVIYNANVRTGDDESNYIGVTENSFKDRLYKHRNSFKYENKINSTELSKHIWDLKKKGITNPVIKWSIIDYAKPYVNGSKTSKNSGPPFNIDKRKRDKKYVK